LPTRGSSTPDADHTGFASRSEQCRDDCAAEMLERSFVTKEKRFICRHRLDHGGHEARVATGFEDSHEFGERQSCIAGER
jgi:hypothetical protein